MYRNEWRCEPQFNRDPKKIIKDTRSLSFSLQEINAFIEDSCFFIPKIERTKNLIELLKIQGVSAT